MDIADVDGDSQLEVIGGGGREHSGALGTFIYAYDAATGAERWHTLQLGDYWSTIKELVIADTDQDNQLEFIGMVDGGDIYVFDGVTLELEATVDTQGSSLTTIPLASGTGLLLGDTLGHASVRAFDGSGYPEVNGADLAATAIDSLNYIGGALWMGSGGTLGRYQNSAVTIQTANYDAGFGRRIGQSPEIPWLFSAGGYGVHGFRRPR